MKVISHCSYLGCSLCLVASSNALVSNWKKSPSYATYEDAKNEFEAKGMIKSLNLDQAKNWFKKAGYSDDFETYFEAKEFFEKKGYLKKVDKLNDGKGEFSFVRDGEAVDKAVFHDVVVSLFLSNFIYFLGTLRKETKTLAFTDEGLKEEVVIGSSFESVSKVPMAGLLQGNLKVSKDSSVRTPEVSMAQFEDVLRYPGYKGIQADFANELTVTSLHSFLTNKLYMHKFDAKYQNKNLVYSIAGRERKDDASNENETDLFLTFRGSSTARDWFQNIQAPLVDLRLRYDPNSNRSYIIEQLTYQKVEIEPDLYHQLAKIVDEAGTPIRVHRGFLEYLFADRGRDGTVDEDKDNDSMYTNIRLNIMRLLDQESTITNNLYVTGHSLGGALCTLASFFLACDEEINNRNNLWRGVKCISYASPIVGNVSFQRAFEVLQSKEQYQSSTAETPPGERLFKNIRITNNRDVVPLAVFFSKYRHTAGVHVHLNRPSILSLWNPRKPKIEAHTAHWKSTFDRKKPWRIFYPTSLICGLFANSFKTLGLFATTVPIALIIPFFLVKSLFVSVLVPSLAQFKLFFSWFANLGIAKTAFVGAIAAATQTPIFKYAVLGLSWASIVHLLTKKNSSTVERTGLMTIGLPGLAATTKHFFTKTSYKHIAQHWQAHFLTGILVAQIAMLFRKPLEVVTVVPHGLNTYYDHLRPHHPLLSSSAVIVDDVAEDIPE